MSTLSFMSRVCGRLRTILKHHQFKYIAKSATVYYSAEVYNPNNLYMEENTNIDGGAIIMNLRARFVMKKWSGAAIGLLVVTGNHMSIVGKNFKQVTNKIKDDLDINHRMDQDVIVDEDVWIGSRVTLLAGTHLGRGCEIGSNAVIRGNIPPYSIVVGNPAKIIGFRFTPEEIIEHEKTLYKESERFSIEILEKNYQKYFLEKTKEIKKYLKI